MTRNRIATLALTASLLTVSGCGGSSAPSSSGTTSTGAHAAATSAAVVTRTGPLNREEMLTRGDAICYRLNAERHSTYIGSREDFARLIPPLAAKELAGAEEMSKLIPPPSLKQAWEKIVENSRTLAEVTGRFHTWAEASNLKLSRPVDAIMTKAMDEVEQVAKKAGFKDCARFT
jgi:hypothetical protein